MDAPEPTASFQFQTSTECDTFLPSTFFMTKSHSIRRFPYHFLHVQHQSLRCLDCGIPARFIRTFLNPEMDGAKMKNVEFFVHNLARQQERGSRQRYYSESVTFEFFHRLLGVFPTSDALFTLVGEATVGCFGSAGRS